MERVDKVIVTHRGALTKKHRPAGMKKINTALSRLVRADLRRGLRTRVVAIDAAADMAGLGRRVTRATDARAVKRAVDDVYRALRPDYLLLLGAPDVIPHVRLTNPMAASRDRDRVIESDLPYACDAPYSADIPRFLGPTRVVGRLPDMPGVGDTDYLVRLIDHAAGWKSRPRADYGRAFVLSAEAWRGSTRTTAGKLPGTNGPLHLSPGEGPYWTPRELEGRIHLINCHGDTGSPEYYGEEAGDPDEQPTCHESTQLAGRITPGTVIAAECCYGAELYEPSTNLPAAICQAYLGEGAWAFFGSTTVAYGPATGNNFADLICGRFLRLVLEGASVGRAALMARQYYVSIGGYMEMIDLKTIAQFLLLGDPSVHPVKAPARAVGPAKVKGAGARRARRKQLCDHGAKLQRGTASVGSRADARVTLGQRRRIKSICAEHHGKLSSISSFSLHAPAGRVHAAMGRRLAAGRTVFHAIVLEEHGPRRRAGKAMARRARVERRRVLVVREVDGKIQKVVEAVRH